jgi:spermidine synthase/spermine synthase
MQRAQALQRALHPGVHEGARQPTLVEAIESRYQRIEVRHHPRYGRQLYIDGDLQISESDQAYNLAMIAPLIVGPECRRAAILGGGDGGVLRELLRAPGAGNAQVTLIDIDAQVIAAARRHLRGICGDAFEHPRAKIVIGDALAYLARARELDAVIYDLTVEPVRAGQSRRAFVEEVVAAMAEALRPGGVLSMQAGGREEAELVREVRAAVSASFTDVIEQRVLVPSFEDLWTFVAARRPG